MKSFRKQFLTIFAISLVATLLLCPGNYSAPGGIRENFSTIEVQAEEPTITDTQKGIALLMTILFAQGLRFVGDWNTVVQPGLQKLWDDFSTATGNAVTIPMIVAGSSLALGYIRTSNTVNNAITNFITWYKQTFSQPVTGDVSVPVQEGTRNYFNIDSCAYIGRASGNNVSITMGFTAPVRAVILNRGAYSRTAYFVSNQNYQYDWVSGCPTNESLRSTATYWNGYYFNSVELRDTNLNTNIPFVDVSGGWSNALLYTYGANAGLPDITMEGQSLDLLDGYQLEQEQAKLYDIANLVALVSELALTLDSIEDLVRDIPLIYDTPWSLDYPDDPTYADTPDDTIPWVTVPDSVIPADTPEYVPTTPGETDSYKILGLERVFPFSIPFDLYYITQILVAEPETPHFTYAIMNPATNQLLTQEFDLHQFDTLAGVIRTGETVVFLVFLIFVTRGLIRS